MSTEQERAERFLFSLSSLAEIGEAIYSNRRNFTESLQWLLEMTLGMMRVGHGAILLYDETSRELVLHAARRLESRDLVIRLAPDEFKYLRGHRIVTFDKFPAELQKLQACHTQAFEALNSQFWVVLGVPEQFLGIMSLGPIFTGEALEPWDRDFLLVLAHHISLAIYSVRLLQQMRDRNFQLSWQKQQLLTLSEVSAEISAVLDPEPLMEQILQNAVSLLDAHSGALFLLESSDFVLQSQWGTLSLTSEFLKEAGIEAAIEQGEAIRIQVAEASEQLGASTLLIAPIKSQESALGVLIVCDKESREGAFLEFDESDEMILLGFANQAGVAIGNARLYQEAKQVRQMEAEMMAAAEIQRGLLPKEQPKRPGYDIAGVSIPRGKVGGDYYDYVEEDEHHQGIVIADVSGKGTQAALLMATLRAGVLYEAGHSELPDMVMRLNDLLYKSTPDDKYATFFYVSLACQTGELSSINAGHNPPLLFRCDGTVEELDESGTFVGAFPNDIIPLICEFKSQQTQMDLGDLLLLYTDGVTEANDIDDELFGVERLCATVQQHKHLPAAELIERIQEAVDAFQGEEVDAFDDLTLVVVKRLSETTLPGEIAQ